MKRALQRHATTLILVILAAIAAVVVLYVEPGSVTTGEAELRKKNLLEVWRPDEISELTVTAQGRTAALHRGAPDDAGLRRWRLEIDGQGYAADEQAVDQVLGTLEFATAERRVSAEATDRAALGLDAPKITIALTMGARRERIVIGGSAPTPPGAMYAEVAGRGVFVITKQLAAALDVPVERLRSRTFVPYLSTELSGLHLEGEGGPRRFTRAPWGGSRGGGFRWDGSTPEGATRAQADAIDRVLVALGQMQAEVFLTDAETAAAAKPEVTLTLLPSDAAAKRAVIEVGGACPRQGAPDGGGDGDKEKAGRVVAVRREPTRAAACVPAGVLEALRAPAREFVDLAPIGAPVDEIAEVKLDDKRERPLEMAREESGWHLRAPEDRKVAADAGRALAQALSDVRAARVIPAGDARGLDPPRATLRVVSTPAGQGGDAPGERVETVEIGAPQGEVVHVRRVEDGAILELPAADADALLPSEIALRPRRLFDFRVTQVRSLRVEAAGRVQRLRRSSAGAWELMEPTGEGLSADLGLASDVVELVSSLEARRWVSAGAGSGYGLGRPRAVIVVELEAGDADAGGAREARVEIGAPTAAGSFARTGDSPAVFVAPVALENAASRLLVNRAAFMVPLDRVARVTLTPDRGPPAVVTPAPGGWRLEGSGDDAASAALAAGVRDVLGDLMAEEAVSLGAAQPDQGLARPRLRVSVELAPAAGEAPPAPIRFALGAGDTLRATSVVYARRDGVDATYAVALSKLRPLLEAAGIR